MTPEDEDERETAIRGMSQVPADLARVRKAQRESKAAYHANVCLYCAKCGHALPSGSPIGSVCWRCDETIAIEKKKVEREDDTSCLTCFVIGVVVGVVALLIVLKFSA